MFLEPAVKALYVGYYTEDPERPMGQRGRPRSFDRDKALASATKVFWTRCLTERYLREVTPEKGASMQRHERTAAEMFCRAFGLDLLVETLGRRDWDRFLRDLRSAALRPAGVEIPREVRDRQVAYDVRFLLTAFNWVCAMDDGRGNSLLARNPFKGLSLPSESSPRRPSLPPDEYANSWGSRTAFTRSCGWQCCSAMKQDIG